MNPKCYHLKEVLPLTLDHLEKPKTSRHHAIGRQLDQVHVVAEGRERMYRAWMVALQDDRPCLLRERCNRCCKPDSDGTRVVPCQMRTIVSGARSKTSPLAASSNQFREAPLTYRVSRYLQHKQQTRYKSKCVVSQPATSPSTVQNSSNHNTVSRRSPHVF